jgi:CBS domain-containing protein
MRFGRLRHLLVERGGVLVGVLSYRDIQDRALDELDRPTPKLPPPTELSVEKLMMESPYIATPDLPLEAAALRLSQLRIGCLPVVEDGPDGPRLVGLVSEADLLGVAFERPPRSTRG